MKCDYLIKNGKIITMNESKETYDRGYVAISADRIVDIGPMDRLDESVVEAREVIDADDKIVMPGFVNAHNHSFNLITRYMPIPMEGVDSFDFGDVLTRWYWPKVEDNNTPEYTYVGALLFASEALKRGVTTTAEMLEGANVVDGGTDKIADAFKKAGLRGNIAFEASERVSKEHGERGLQNNIDFAEKWNDKDDIIKGTMSVHTAFSSSPEYIRKTREMADKLKTPLQIHIAQSQFEVDFVKEHMGYRGSVYLLDDAGFLGPDVIAAHCIYINDEEIDLLAKNKVNISFNTKSNERAANGVCPVPKFKERGMNVGLGLDGINIMDMHEMMVHAAYLIRTANLDRNLLPNKEVLEMATMNGARALGMDKEIGSLEKNKKADLIMVDLKDKLTTAPLFDVWEAAAFGARGSDVEMVMVNGDIKVRDYEVKNVDATELIREAERVAVEYKEKILSTPVADSWELTTI